PFGGGVELHWMISIAVFAKRHGRAGTIHTARACVDEVRRLRAATSLKDVSKRDHIALDVGMRVDQRVPHTRLSRQVYHAIKYMPSKARGNHSRIRQVSADELVITAGPRCCLFQELEARLLDARIVVIIYHIESHHSMTLLEQPPGGVKANETGVAGDENLHEAPRFNHSGVTSSNNRKKSRAAPLVSCRARLAPWARRAMMMPSIPPANPPKTLFEMDRRDSPTTGSRGFSSTVITGVSRTSRIRASSRFCRSDVYTC